MLIAIPAAASNAPGGQTSINKIAIEAYCSEAQSKSALLADGSVSYKRVADLASEPWWNTQTFIAIHPPGKSKSLHCWINTGTSP
jgi:hypothetical protein